MSTTHRVILVLKVELTVDVTASDSATQEEILEKARMMAEIQLEPELVISECLAHEIEKLG